jgi:hypothetical protein
MGVLTLHVVTWASRIVPAGFSDIFRKNTATKMEVPCGEPGLFLAKEHHVMVDLFRGCDGQLQGFTGPKTMGMTTWK